MRDNTRLDRKRTATIKRRQQTTNTHKMHSVQLVFPLCRSVPWSLLRGSLSFSISSYSICLYLIAAALSLATCSARSLILTCSNCQGSPLLGGIKTGARGWKVWETEDEMEGTTAKNEKEDFKLWGWSSVSYTVFVRGEVRSGNFFWKLHPPSSIIWCNTYWLERHK